jgi:MbtH protein
METAQSEQLYDVVLNDEGQYSIWPIEKLLPRGWNKTGVQGAKETCLSYINENWTDMRPISLRKQMAAAD